MIDAHRLPGRVLNDTYRIERQIAEGGMGAIFEATHLRLARRVAVKVLAGSTSADPNVIRRFQREAEVTSAIGHPNIVEVIDFDRTEEGAPYLVMELLEGEDLSERLRRDGRLSLADAAAILGQVASALRAAHERGIVHRDLKPRNVFLCRRDGRDELVKVVDFGISKILGAETQLTRSNALLGTPHYMAPEQAEEKVDLIDPRTDIFALGVILYEMLSGEPPFSAPTALGVLYRIVHDDLPDLSQIRPDLPQEIVRVIARALSKQPSERFASMNELWIAFADAAALTRSEGVQVASVARAEGPLAVAGRPAPARWALATGASLALGAAALLALALYPYGRPKPLERPPEGRPRRASAVARSADARPWLAGGRDRGLDGLAASALVTPSHATRAAAPPSSASRRAGRPRRQRGELRVTAKLGGHLRTAAIYLDGEHRGETPLLLRGLGRGRHRVEARMPGHGNQLRVVEVRPERKNRVVFEFSARRAAEPAAP